MRFSNVVPGELKRLIHWTYCLLRSLLDTLRKSFGRFKELGNRAKIKIFKLLGLAPMVPKRMVSKRVVGALTAVVVLSALIIGLGGGFITLTFHSSGKVITRGVGLYEDSASSRAVSEFRWGMVEPGLTNYIDAYLRNEGNVPIKLSLYSVNWAPANASSYMDFGWDYNDSTLDPDAMLKVTFHLSVSPDVEGVGDFAFDVIIDAYNT